MNMPASVISHLKEQSFLLDQIREERLAHALLISGEAGTGKWTLACYLASALLCQGQGKKPCGICKSCRQMEAMEHPDLILLQKGVPISSDRKSRSNIPVSDIREMIRQISMHAAEGEQHVVLIRHAEDLGLEAQNALLKTLEDPPAGTYFLLTAIHVNELLPTIRSRCQPLKLNAWTEEEIKCVLIGNGTDEARARHAASVARGSIGEAINLSVNEDYWRFRKEVIHDFLDCPSRSDILSVSTRWKDRKAEAELLFSVIEDFLTQLMHKSLHISESQEPLSFYPDKWKIFAKKAGAENYTRLFDQIRLARKRTDAMVNFQAVIEQLILLLMEAVNL